MLSRLINFVPKRHCYDLGRSRRGVKTVARIEIEVRVERATAGIVLEQVRRGGIVRWEHAVTTSYCESVFILRRKQRVNANVATAGHVVERR